MGWVGCLCCHGNHGGTDLSYWIPVSTVTQPEEDIGGEGLRVLIEIFMCMGACRV